MVIFVLEFNALIAAELPAYSRIMPINTFTIQNNTTYLSNNSKMRNFTRIIEHQSRIYSYILNENIKENEGPDKVECS